MYTLELLVNLLQHIQQPQQRETPGATPPPPSLRDECNLVLLCTTHRIYGFTYTSHPKNVAVMVKCLTLGHKCRHQDLNPHSTVQKNNCSSPFLFLRFFHEKSPISHGQRLLQGEGQINCHQRARCRLLLGLQKNSVNPFTVRQDEGMGVTHQEPGWQSRLTTIPT